VEIGRHALTKLPMIHAYFLIMKGIICTSDGKSIQPKEKKTHEDTLSILIAGGVSLTSVPIAKTEDKSKADGHAFRSHGSLFNSLVVLYNTFRSVP
jgi:hypothetical protein